MIISMTIVMMMMPSLKSYDHHSHILMRIMIIDHHHKDLLLGVAKGVDLPSYFRDRTLAKSICLQLKGSKELMLYETLIILQYMIDIGTSTDFLTKTLPAN